MINNELLHNISDNLATRFERELFVASIENITNSTSPIRFNNFAYAIRELTRHILANLAPDNEVLNSKWYKNETCNNDGITRTQRIYYAIHGGLLPDYVQNVLNVDVETFNEKFSDIIKRLNKYTHIERKTFGLDETNIFLYTNQTLETLAELFSFIKETEVILKDALHHKMEIALINLIVEQTFSSVDRLASHHSLENVHTEILDLLSINFQFIYFEASGTLNYRMQWGSDSDVSNGDGVVFSRNIPFSCKLKSNVLNPNEITVDIASIVVDADEEENYD